MENQSEDAQPKPSQENNQSPLIEKTDDVFLLPNNPLMWFCIGAAAMFLAASINDLAIRDKCQGVPTLDDRLMAETYIDFCGQRNPMTTSLPCIRLENALQARNLTLVKGGN